MCTFLVFFFRKIDLKMKRKTERGKERKFVKTQENIKFFVVLVLELSLNSIWVSIALISGMTPWWNVTHCLTLWVLCEFRTELVSLNFLQRAWLMSLYMALLTTPSWRTEGLLFWNTTVTKMLPPPRGSLRQGVWRCGSATSSLTGQILRRNLIMTLCPRFALKWNY